MRLLRDPHFRVIAACYLALSAAAFTTLYLQDVHIHRDACRIALVVAGHDKAVLQRVRRLCPAER